MSEIPAEYEGWWRIVHLEHWSAVDLDILGPALLSLTGHDDRLRMFVLLAHVQAKPTETGDRSRLACHLQWYLSKGARERSIVSAPHARRDPR